MPFSLAVLIPSHRRADLLSHCLRSLQAHAPSGTEIWVIDDGSRHAAISAAAQQFPGVRVIRQPRPRGFCAAINAGLRAAGAEIVEFLNDDTEVTAGWAEAALACFADPTVAAVAPLVLGQAGVDSAGDRYYVGGIAGKRGHRQPITSEALQRRRVFGASGSSGFFRRTCLLQVGGLPEEFGAYFEDVDLAFRLHWAGYQVLFEPAARVYHHGAASYGRTGRRLLQQQARNEERVFWRNLPRRDLLRALPMHLAVLAAKGWRRWRQGEFVPFLFGRLSVAGELPAVLRQRRWLRQFSSPDSLREWEVEESFWG